MAKTELNDALRKLRAELESVEPDDDRVRDNLARLDREIHRILQSPGDITPDHGHGLRESLERSTASFGASHPTLTILMRRILKALSDMGI